jgi:hypothetical protein
VSAIIGNMESESLSRQDDATDHPLTLKDGRRLYLVTFERHDRTQHVLAYGSSRARAIRAAEDQWGGVAANARLVR